MLRFAVAALAVLLGAAPAAAEMGSWQKGLRSSGQPLVGTSETSEMGSTPVLFADDKAPPAAPLPVPPPGKPPVQGPAQGPVQGPVQGPSYKAPVQGPVQASGPVQAYVAPQVQYCQKTIWVPTYVQEMRKVCSTEYRNEVRERRYTVQRLVRTPRQVEQQYTEMVTVNKVRQEEYCVTRAVYRDVPQEYMVMRPVERVRQERFVVNKPVWREVQENYTVMIPEQQVRNGVRMSCKVVEDTVMRNEIQDQGRWEDRTALVPTCGPSYGCGYGGYGGGGYRGCGRWACGYGCGDCYAECAPVDCVTTCTYRVWVPNCVTIQVPVKVCRIVPVEVPFQYQVTIFRPEARQRTLKVCDFVPEEQVRDVRYVECVPERQVRNVRVCDYVTEKKVRDVPYCDYVPVTRTRMVQVMDCSTVAEEKVEQYNVSIPYPVTREVPVTVCKMVAKVITVPVTPCAPCGPCQGAVGGCGGGCYRRCCR